MCSLTPHFENLKIRNLNLFRASANFIKSGVFRIYLTVFESIINVADLTNFRIFAKPFSRVH
jgi:hypothetical protein